MKAKRKLSTKLFFSYTLVTTLAFFLLELVAFGTLMVAFINSARLTPQEIDQEVEERWVTLVQPYLTDSPQLRSLVQVVLKKFKGFVLLSNAIEITELIHLDFQTQNYLTLIFLDKDGYPIDSIPHPNAEAIPEIPLEDELRMEMIANPDRIYTVTMPEEEQVAIVSAVGRYYAAVLEQRIRDSEFQVLIDNLYAGDTSFEATHRITLNQTIGIVPIYHPNNKAVLIGAIAYEAHLAPWEVLEYQDFYTQILILMGITLLISALMGTFFGFLASRGLVNRLGHFSTTISKWSEGNFAPRIVDKEKDELNVVAEDLNEMSEHFESLLQEKQELSIIRERNRLARDLHDMVKQETFAASAQLGAAKTLLKKDPEKASQQLGEADNILDRVRANLTSLIHELYPTQQRDINLVDAIFDFGQEWERIYHIQVKIKMDQYMGMPHNVEHAFFMVVQEALSNVARHSNATEVEIFLKQNPHYAFVMICDNGIGMPEDKKPSHSIGIKSMNERARLLGGTLEIASKENEGTCVRMEVPLEEKNGKEN
ncbi:MAG: histidine kinase [Anaerolineae bacterium]|jgi:NarL family two-component system sensor histidine kinase LiaS|nr:histidine kinase [Anaerolineae bacterium]